MKRITLIPGFTLLEVLTALAIIALLISVMMPTMSMVQRAAQGVKQKAQFNTIEMGLEAFRGDGYDYPPSAYTATVPTPPGNGTGYCGAQKLAEALVGLDGFGFHPKSQWRSDGLGDINGDGILDPLYSGSAGFAALSQTDKEKNYKARQGPYLEMENSNAFSLSTLYPYPGKGGWALDNDLAGTYVVCDMYGRRNPIANKKIGMPILYFRADTSNLLLRPSTLGNNQWNTSKDAIYNVTENYPFYMNPPHWGLAAHPMSDSRMPFYNRIANPNFPGTAANSYRDARPYRSQSFILLSAGADGLYGSQDDVYNINEGEK